ncbi:hypothetical protein EVAR_54657_1 [Eumeta japonica]|uniref:Uncharacterized protein n=1 Tax=Eumeta variegata TaxID=151549 RepID=A0A4C1X8J7_EUMVA|nr:hypothetical protein EVAR_54657_1 [Eumeta japonica]
MSQYNSLATTVISKNCATGENNSAVHKFAESKNLHQGTAHQINDRGKRRRVIDVPDVCNTRRASSGVRTAPSAQREGRCSIANTYGPASSRDLCRDWANTIYKRP